MVPIGLVISAAVGLFYLADPVLLLLCGEQSFLAAAPVLRVMVASVVLVSMTAVLGQILYAARECIDLRITAIKMNEGAGTFRYTRLRRQEAPPCTLPARQSRPAIEAGRARPQRS